MLKLTIRLKHLYTIYVDCKAPGGFTRLKSPAERVSSRQQTASCKVYCCCEVLALELAAAVAQVAKLVKTCRLLRTILSTAPCCTCG